MRKTMTEIIKRSTHPSGLPLTPNFESSCIKQHCDPIMGTCFDVSMETVDIRSLLKEDDIHDVIGNALEGNLLEINYCLCLVVNNTPDTNPPKIPYIDLTDMKKEYDRITRFKQGEGANGLILFRQGVDDVRGEGNPQIDLFVNAIKQKIEYHTGYNYEHWISKDIIVEGKLGSTLDSIRTLYEQSQYISIGQMNTIATMINIIKTDKNVAVFKQLIDTIDKNNNLTTLGTLEFADQISKYNLKYEGCGVDISLHRDHDQSQLYFDKKKKYFRSSNNLRRLYKNKLEIEYTSTQPQAQAQDEQENSSSSQPPENHEIPNLTGGTNSKKYTKKIFPKLKLKKNRITIKKSC